jgi:hypothetical protein
MLKPVHAEIFPRCNNLLTLTYQFIHYNVVFQTHSSTLNITSAYWTGASVLYAKTVKGIKILTQTVILSIAVFFKGVHNRSHRKSIVGLTRNSFNA